MHRMVVRGLAAVAWAVLGGCAAPMVFIPDEIGERGLVVGQVVPLDMPEVLYGDPVIDGKTMIGGMRSGYIAVALDPGEHTLSRLSRIVSSTSVPTAVGTYYSTQHAYYPIERKFTVAAGKVTNLGLVVLQRNPPPPNALKDKQAFEALLKSSGFRVTQLDNGREMAVFLQETHPSLYASLASKSPQLAPGSYLDAAQRAQLRHGIAARRLRDRQWQREHDTTAGYVAGPAGTLARVVRDPGGKVNALKVLETETLSDLTHCGVAAAHAACLVSTSEYLLARGETVTRRALPPGVVGNSLFALRDGGIVLVDSAMNVHTSRDAGASWSKFGGAARAKPLERDSYRPDPRHRFGFHAGRDGFYVFSLDMSASETVMAYADYRSLTYRRLELPKTVEEIAVVRETEAGVYIGPADTEFAKATVHFLPAGKTRWEVRELPQSGCTDIAFADNSGRRVQVLCRGDSVWKSDDAGASWSRIFRVNSLFAA